MTELEITMRAKSYIDSLAQGIDPITGKMAKADDVINNLRISRCLYYVSGILQKVIDNGGEVQKVRKKRSDKMNFSLTDEQIAALKPDIIDLSVSKIVRIINEQIDDEIMNKLKVTTVTNWLVSVGLLEEINEKGRTLKMPTDEGSAIGMKIRQLVDNGVTVKYVVYTSGAQQFIFDNINTIIEFSLQEENDKSNQKISDEQIQHQDNSLENSTAMAESDEYD